MKLCFDENIKRSITDILTQEGYDVVRVQDELELEFEDAEIVSFCRENNRVLLTNDDDFSVSMIIPVYYFWTSSGLRHAMW